MLNHFSHVQLFATPWTVAHQARLSLGFSWQEYQIGLPLPPRGNLPKPGIELVYLTFPVLADGFFTTSTTWEALNIIGFCYKNTMEGHTPRKGLVRTQQEGSCLQARKRALTRNWRDLHLISDFQPPELWGINVVVWKKGKKEGAQCIWYKRLLKHASAVDSVWGSPLIFFLQQVSLSPAATLKLSLSAAAEEDLWSESQAQSCLLLGIVRHHCVFFSP